MPLWVVVRVCQVNVRRDRDGRVFPTGGDVSYPERGICVAKGRLETVLL